jgi:DNA-binding CsgD family transcriptional regulator
MDRNNKSSKSNTLKDYNSIKTVWQEKAVNKSDKVLTEALKYLASLSPLTGTGPSTTTLLDLETSQFKGYIGDFENIFGLPYKDNLELAVLIPNIFPSHHEMLMGHHQTYINHILSCTLEERNRVQYTNVYQYKRDNQYYWLNVRVHKQLSNDVEKLGYVIVEYTDITNVKNDLFAKYIVYDEQQGYIINEAIHTNSDAFDSLTPTELEVSKLIAKGLSDKEIADVQASAVATIKQHKKNIFSKLGINKSTELVALTYASGLVS